MLTRRLYKGAYKKDDALGLFNRLLRGLANA